MGGRLNFRAFTAPEQEDIKKSLTDDEAAVFEQRAKGKSVIATGFAVGMSDSTVKRHSRNIDRKIQKLHAMNRRTTTEYIKENCGP